MAVAMPRFIVPMAAKSVQALPDDERWQYEVKWDGYRALILKSGASVRIRSRNDKDLTGAYRGVAAAALRLRAEAAIVDGEIVAVDSAGRPSFQALQNRGSHPHHTIAFYAFDLLHCDGRDLTRAPLLERQQVLADVVSRSGILLSSPLPGTAAQVVAAVRGIGLEGVIAKRKDSRYDAGARTGQWVKLKLERQQEFVIGGFRPGPHGIDSLLVGFYDARSLKFAGKVRAGFTPHVRREVRAALQPFLAATCPFADLPNDRTSHWGGGVTEEQMAEMQWVKPRLVAQVRFVEWTADNHLRHAAFLGLRTDKKPGDVRREG